MSKHLALVATILAAAIFQIGCASRGFNRGELKEQIGVTKPKFDDKDIKEAYNKKPNLPKPFRLAVYFKNPSNMNRPDFSWHWSPADKAFLEEIGKALTKDNVVADVFPIVGSIVQDEDLRSLRLIAAKHQADALLVVSGAGQIDRYINNWGWTYALVVPALFVKGSQADTLFMSSASLWDVKNEYLYLTAETEATTSDRYIAAFGKQDKELIDEAKTKSLQNLKGEIEKMIRGTKL